jgi:hypothetical protein
MSTPPVLRTRPQTTVIQPIKRGLANIVADVVISEEHEDESVITKHPVEEGAVISDHAYDQPAEVTLTYGWSMTSSLNNDNEGDAFLRNVYQSLLQLKSQRIPFKIFTGKRLYQNMLIQRIHVTTERGTENFLYVMINCQEVLMATTQTVQISDAAVQTLPSKTGPDQEQGPVNLQPGTNFNNGGPQ